MAISVIVSVQLDAVGSVQVQQGSVLCSVLDVGGSWNMTAEPKVGGIRGISAV